ncbi:hypothetical protein D3C76_911660 [compost metagenome]
MAFGVPQEGSAMGSTQTIRETCLLGSDRAGTALLTQAAAAVQLRAYCAFGYRAGSGGASLGFSGEYLDSGTQGYLLGSGYRLYSPALQRFCSVDSLSPFAEGGLNAYAYCAGDPVNRVDASGHSFSITGVLKALRVMKRTGRTSRSEFSVLSFDQRKGQPVINAYKALNEQDPEFLKAQNLELRKTVHELQIESVTYEYMFKESIGVLGEVINSTNVREARLMFEFYQQQIIDRSVSAIRDGRPPRQSVHFAEQSTATP